MARAIEINTRIRYSTKWLRSVGAYTGELPFARGTVTALEKISDSLMLAVIRWDKESEDVPSRVNVKNLEIL